MKVKELIAELNKLDQNLNVYCYCEDSESVEQNNTGPYDVMSGTKTQAVPIRDPKTNRAGLRFDSQASNSIPMALIEITSDF